MKREATSRGSGAKGVGIERLPEQVFQRSENISHGVHI